MYRGGQRLTNGTTLDSALTFWYGAQLIATEGLSFTAMNTALFGVLMSAISLGQIAGACLCWNKA